MSAEVEQEIRDSIHRDARVAMMIAEARGQELSFEQAIKQVS
tara:strand:+ start:7990 stop:8115 length:126 start_codon:yes stop_codon:yes gene_type:complete